MEKINIAELLKDCPKNMELDCTICNGVKFIELDRNPNFTIVVRANNGYEFSLTKYGQVHNIDDAKCVIFPKGKTTWEGFIPPCKFKDGDVIYTDNFIAILSHIEENGVVWYHCYYYIDTKKFKAKSDFGIGNINHDEFRFATEEEKQKLFQVIKDNGYKWNEETKTLDKFPKFKVGDKITDRNKFIYRITEVTDKGYKLHDLKTTFITFEEADLYFVKVVDVFDITTLKPFDWVLVRDRNDEKWGINLFGYYNKSENQYYCIGFNDIGWDKCIPYEANKELLGTTNDCDEFYKTW